MRIQQVLAQLAAWGSESRRKINARDGAGENQYGVGVGELRALAKKLGTDHDLALELWTTGNADARLLAVMLMDPARLERAEIEALAKPLTYAKLVDELSFAVVAKTQHAVALRTKWMKARQESLGRAGWNLAIAKLLQGEGAALDLDGLLEAIETGILAAPKRKQEAMNRCLVEIGVRCADRTGECLALGQSLGRFDDRPVPKGCTSTYAPEWIAAALKRKK